MDVSTHWNRLDTPVSRQNWATYFRTEVVLYELNISDFPQILKQEKVLTKFPTFSFFKTDLPYINLHLEDMLNHNFHRVML
jgi:hypothetical protein